MHVFNCRLDTGRTFNNSCRWVKVEARTRKEAMRKAEKLGFGKCYWHCSYAGRMVHGR